MAMSRKREQAAGFSLLELLASLAVFLVISAAVMSGMFSFQKGYRSQEIRVALEERTRAAVELMSQEIGQAGLPGSRVDTDGLQVPLTTLSAAITSPTTTSSMAVTPDASGIVPGEILTVDNGLGVQETVQVSSVAGTTINIYGKFLYPHAVGAAVWALGTYPGGVLYPTPAGATNGWAYPTNMSQNLYMFGDLNSVGNSAILAKYACPAASGGAFTRQRFDVVTGNALDAQPVTLVDNVTYCNFTYTCAPPGLGPRDCSSTTPVVQPAAFVPSPTNAATISPAPSTQSYMMVVGIGFSITAQSQTKDPVSNQIVTVSKTFLNIQPRNVLAANHEQASGIAEKLELQPYDRTVGVFAKIAAGQI